MTTDVDELRHRAKQLAAQVVGKAAEDEVDQACKLVEDLRNARLYPELVDLAEAVSRRLPNDSRIRRLYAQGLIEQGRVTAAIDMLRPLAATLPQEHPEHAEATGLLGRAYKQIFLDAADQSLGIAAPAFENAVALYGKAFEDNPCNTWHGVNLLALVSRAQRLGLNVAPDLDAKQIAQRVIAELNKVPAHMQNEWHLPTLAEASLGLNDWDAVEAALRKYVADDHPKVFTIASTLRQFTQVWDIESIDERGKALAAILRARLLQLSSGEVELSPEALKQARAQSDPPAAQLEAILGDVGTKTWKWWKTGLDRASAVCCVRRILGDRIGSGWLVRAGSLGYEPADELLVITNFHVLNPQGLHNAVTPESGEVVFEAADENKPYTVREVVWSSPLERHDCSVLRLTEPVGGLVPLPIANGLPTIEKTARVYVIGHPGGRDLSFSLQDNALIDHEGPPDGRPFIEGVCRVHYLAPTEKGSSGSPVFNASRWEVIALHHSGGKEGMPKLNGQPGSYGANEGIGIQSIIQAMAQKR